MNIEEYISSGIIETYVLGFAGEEDARELEELCHQYPEIQAAVREAEASLGDYAQLNSITPPAGAKEQIWAAIVEADNQVEPLLKDSEAESSK